MSDNQAVQLLTKMADNQVAQFYVFAGIGVVGVLMLYSVARMLSHVIKQLNAMHFSISSLHTAFEHANVDMQRRVHDIVAATERSSGHLNVLVQPIREAEQRRRDAELGIYR